MLLAQYFSTKIDYGVQMVVNTFKVQIIHNIGVKVDVFDVYFKVFGNKYYITGLFHITSQKKIENV